jgi:short-subunit dehydrogenase
MLECAGATRLRGPHRQHGLDGGLLNAPAMGVYNVSKHAVVSLSETLYHDLQLVDAPIGASVLCPYFVPTGITSRTATARGAESRRARRRPASWRRRR